MSNITVKRLLSAALIPLSLLLAIPNACSQEEIEYKKFKLENASCDVGIRYKKTPQGVILGVSAIATGKGSEFRKWSIPDIKLRIGSDRIRPDHYGNFYVTDESLFRVPGAILIGVLAGLHDYGGSNFNNTLSQVCVGLGVGLIALTAKGEITGQRCVFYIPSDVFERIEEGRDSIEIAVANEDQHLKDSIRIGIVRPSFDTEQKYSFKGMSEDAILERMDLLKAKIVSLEDEQSAYKYGQDPEFDAIERKIEALETQRGLAYKAWYEKKNGPDKVQ
jgi:hypothetical protein